MHAEEGEPGNEAKIGYLHMKEIMGMGVHSTLNRRTVLVHVRVCSQ